MTLRHLRMDTSNRRSEWHSLLSSHHTEEKKKRREYDHNPQPDPTHTCIGLHFVYPLCRTELSAIGLFGLKKVDSKLGVNTSTLQGCNYKNVSE